MQYIVSIIIMAVLAVFVAVAIASFVRGKKRGKKVPVGGVVGIIGTVICLTAIAVIPGGFYTVDNGEVAVVKEFGEFKDVAQPGLHFRNVFTTTIERYSVQVQELRVDKEAYSKDLQAVEVSQVIQFTIKTEEIRNINTKYGTLEVLKQRIASISNEAIEESAKLFDAKDLVTRRDEFNSQIKQNIGNKFEQYYITINQTILDNIVFSIEFENMIQASKLAEQELEKDKQRLEKELQESAYKVKVAEEEAKERIAKAKGDADAVKAAADAESYKVTQLAEAEANRIKTIADAEAEAVKIKLAELDAASPEALAYLEYLAWVESWDGKLPSTMLGDGTSVIIPTP